MKAARFSAILVALPFTLLLGQPPMAAAQTPLQGPGSGLVGWWKMDETSGNVVHDSSGAGNNGVLIGAAGWTAQGPTGRALLFDGYANYIRMPYSATLALGQKTIAAWINLTDFQKINSSLYGWGRNETGFACYDNFFTFFKSSSQVHGAYVNGANAPKWDNLIGGFGTGKLGQWAHYVVTYEGGETGAVRLALYKNGALVGTPYTASDGMSTHCAMTAIGSQEDLPNPEYTRTFAGMMADYRIYNRALPVAEIVELYNQANPAYTDVTVPSVPTGLTAVAVSSYQVDLSWTASSDSGTGVAGYIVYRGGAPLAAVRSGTSYSDKMYALSTPTSTYAFALAPSTSYTYTVAAYDAAYNVSSASTAASVTTPPASGVTHTLTVSKSGSPTGTITSVPAGVNCGSTCTYSFPEGTWVVLAPYPFIMANKNPPINPPFTGWTGGGCNGIGECYLRMDSDKSVTAYYGTAVPPDTMPPTVTAFSIPTQSANLMVPVTAFSATDDIGVTAYLLSESPEPPLPGDATWGAAPPTTYTFPSGGLRSLYAWVRDAAGNVSSTASAAVSIALASYPAAPYNLRILK